MGDEVLTFYDYLDKRPCLYDTSSAAISSGSDSSWLAYIPDNSGQQLATSIATTNTSADWNTSITTGEFWPNYTFQNYFTYNTCDVEKEIAEEINRLVLNEIEQKYLIKSIPKDLLKIKKAKINKCYLIKI